MPFVVEENEPINKPHGHQDANFLHHMPFLNPPPFFFNPGSGPAPRWSLMAGWGNA